MRNVIFPTFTTDFAIFRKQFARFAKPLTPQDTNSLKTKETLIDAPHKSVEKA